MVIFLYTNITTVIYKEEREKDEYWYEYKEQTGKAGNHTEADGGKLVTGSTHDCPEKRNDKQDNKIDDDQFGNHFLGVCADIEADKLLIEPVPGIHNPAPVAD